MNKEKAEENDVILRETEKEAKNVEEDKEESDDEEEEEEDDEEESFFMADNTLDWDFSEISGTPSDKKEMDMEEMKLAAQQVRLSQLDGRLDGRSSKRFSCKYDLSMLSAYEPSSSFVGSSGMESSNVQLLNLPGSASEYWISVEKEIIKLAKEADAASNYLDAIELYQSAIKYIKEAMRALQSTQFVDYY